MRALWIGFLFTTFAVCLSLALVQLGRWRRANRQTERAVRQWREARERENRKRHSLGRWLKENGGIQ